MATLTINTIASFMHIIFAMTLVACRRRPQLRTIGRPGMAILTLHISVTCFQFEVGTPVVIEIPNAPVPRIVTGIAFRPETQLMLVVFLMAGITVRLRILKFRSLVTLLAFRIEVLAQQRKLGLVMIEPNIVLPALLAMAILALLPFLAIMLIVLLMAGITIRRRLLTDTRRSMALIALDILVLKFQRVLGVLVMIEVDILPTPFVVALLALLTQIAMMPLVVIGFLVAVVADILQLLLVKLAGMALVAFHFEVLET